MAETAEHKAAPPAPDVPEVLGAALEFVNKASGSALALAMSSDHPNPDGVLMEIVDAGLALAPRLAVMVRDGVDRGAVLTQEEASFAARCVRLVFGDEAGGYADLLAKLETAGR